MSGAQVTRMQPVPASLHEPLWAWRCPVCGREERYYPDADSAQVHFEAHAYREHTGKGGA